MYLNEFDYVIVGNEPAGLWLLQKLVTRYPNVTTAWIELDGPPDPTILPASVASRFGISVGNVWRAEIVSPKRSLSWDKASLIKAFPALNHALQSKAFQKGSFHRGKLDALSRALTKNPDLLGFAHAIWKSLGRAPSLQGERLLLSALQIEDLTWWHPALMLSSQITRISARSRGLIEELRTHSRGTLSIKLQGQDPIVAKKWILNDSWGKLLSLSPEISKLLPSPEDPRAETSLYRFQIRTARKNIPSPVGPLTLLLDTECIPDPDTEIWPLFLKADEKEVVLEPWVSGPKVAPLDLLLDGFRKSVSRVNRLFPFLPFESVHYKIPLNLESCFSDDVRIRISEEIETSSIETYERAVFQTATRHPNVVLINPSAGCHHPNPEGPLEMASFLFEQWTKKHKPKEKKGQSLFSTKR